MAYTTIDDPSAHFQTMIFTGDGNDNRAITNDGNSNLQPDWIWFKNRDTTNSHNVLDSTRGVGKTLEGTNSTTAEGDTSTRLTSFDSDGFTVRTDPSVNGNTNDIVAWQWKANGGTTTTNDASATSVGTIDSVYQANTTAGFSIVTHTGSGSAGNIAHGLGAVPEWVLTKNRSQSASWANYHKGAGNEYYLELDTTDAREAGSSVWGDTTPSSTTFRVGGANTKNNSSSDNFVSFCFAPIQGYSKFGTYTGNSDANGTFVYLGFKPAWLMFKKTSGSDGWGIFDNRRNTQQGNPRDIYLQPNSSNADSSESDSIDFLSNGFKWRISSGFRNETGSTYVYFAFAEHPFVSSKGVPVTAG